MQFVAHRDKKKKLKSSLWVCMWNEMDLNFIESRCEVKQHQAVGALCWKVFVKIIV